MNRRFAALILFVLLCHPSAFGEFARRLAKPQNFFFFPQANLHVGYASTNPRRALDWANRGAPTQIALEFFYKDQIRVQRGYTKWIALEAAQLKGTFEWLPRTENPFHPRPRFRLLATFVKLDTKWDRTKLWIGHRRYPYGHNPRLDPDLAFLPNQADGDFGFGRDKGLFLKTPLSQSLDLESSLTLGMGDSFDYYGGFLATVRVGTPTFEASELGGFVLGGKVQNVRGIRTLNSELLTLFRLGADQVYKFEEKFKLVNQISLGRNNPESGSQSSVLNLLNNFEWFAGSGWVLGACHLLVLTTPDSLSNTTSKGTLFGMLSYAPTRLTRVRLNLYSEYTPTSQTRDYGVAIQTCIGCGLRK